MAELIEKNGDEITVSVTMKLTGSFLEMENTIQDAVNEVGTIATTQAISRFDATGDPIQLGKSRMTAKHRVPKKYETPYGPIEYARYVYQSAGGGKTYCPLDDQARIIISSTPRFAKIISHKYTNDGATEVQRDLEVSHNRNVARSFLQNVANFVGGIAEATEQKWEYTIPEQTESVKAITISLDGTTIRMAKDGYREAMTGAISLYNGADNRLHSIYIGASPEYGKEKFITRLEKEIYAVKLQYPNAEYIGVADGAKTNWDFLEKHTNFQILDFYHAAEYLADASYAVSTSEKERKLWLDDACTQLKHDNNGAEKLLIEMKKIVTDKLSDAVKNKLKTAITYFTNQKHRMDYPCYRSLDFPIGSGVTEAACKTLIKQRLCCSGMKWSEKGARMLLALRSLARTATRFDQFWERINAVGLSSINCARS